MALPVLPLGLADDDVGAERAGKSSHGLGSFVDAFSVDEVDQIVKRLIVNGPQVI